MQLLALILTSIFVFQAPAAIKDPVYDNYEGLDLVEALIRDGNLKAAAEESEIIPPSDRKSLAIGHLEYAAKRYALAVKSYLRVPESAQRNLFLARAYAKSEDWDNCHRVVGKTNQLWLEHEEDIVIKANCEYRVQEWQVAHSTLSRGLEKWPTFVLQRELTSLLLEMGLSRAALDVVFLSRVPSATEALALAELFHNKKWTDDSLAVLEWARARHPFDVDTNLSLAKVYFGKGLLRATSEAFERAAIVDSRYAYHAAEIRRQLGDIQIAQYWTVLVPNEKERLKARMAIYVDGNRYPIIASMENVLAASPLKTDDEVRYALSYSLTRLGDFSRPLKYLAQIRSPSLVERAALLRKSILETAHE